MCSRKSEGFIYDRCAHYVPSQFVDKRDCGQRYCALSAAHPRSCKNCNCDRRWYPDHEQCILGHREGACNGCFAFFAARPVVPARR